MSISPDPVMDVALDAATKQFTSMPSSNCWDYTRAIVSALRAHQMIDPRHEHYEETPAMLPEGHLYERCEDPECEYAYAYRAEQDQPHFHYVGPNRGE